MTAMLTAHTDVVCPPDQTAICGRCNEALMYHPCTDGPDAVVTPDNAVCLDSAALRRMRIQYLHFELAAGESLDCPNVGRCAVCDVEICSEHSNEFVVCAESTATLHHVDCRDLCDPCSRSIAADRGGDR
jgi:hypothetical protein